MVVRQRIAIDMDEVTADALSRHLELYNREFNMTLTVEHLQGKIVNGSKPTLVKSASSKICPSCRTAKR
jgi:5'(3')-deoxyribonucleotidase